MNNKSNPPQPKLKKLSATKEDPTPPFSVI